MTAGQSLEAKKQDNGYQLCPQLRMELNYQHKSSEIAFCSDMQEHQRTSQQFVMDADKNSASNMPLNAKKGGLVISQHNEVRDELGDLAAKAFIPSMVCNEPRIHTSCTMGTKTAQAEKSQVNQNLKKSQNEDHGDLLIRGLWAHGTDCILDIHVTDTDANGYQSKDPKKVLAAQEREKKNKYLQPCLDQHRHFTPFVISTDGLMGKEAKATIQRLSAQIAENEGKPYSQVCGHANE